MTSNDISTPKKAESAPRQALELLAEEWEIEGIQLCDGVHASVPNAFAGQTYQRCAQELREALLKLDPAALRARADIEADGMRAGLDGHAGTHNPYIWKGSPEHRDAWGRGQQAVEKYGQDRYQMGYEKAQEVAVVTREPALRAQAEADKGLRGAVVQLMSDPWSYHYEESGTTKRCVGCGEKEGAAHDHWCPIPSITAALAQAGGEGQ
ncbi:hypothetical protein GCM10008956_15200 [Deinococcus arenae]|uniref:Uncharacterized protein n=1 Tax=Deinococcus arenae TaxID=1452751 RepID=A0A8H9GML3_9DEIO|nr:hypothetical protein [Deinococcus arenae]GGM39715.1 hypothetical protein GCM10008956_15200 [Deinococcus arenae]